MILKAKLETRLDGLLSRSPAQPLFLWRASRRLTVLAYHGVDDPQRFAEQLDFLARTMRPVSLEDVLDAMAGRRGLPRKAVLITFDDGERSLFDVGLPLLRERGLPAVAFVVAGLLDTDQPHWWVEVERLARQGGCAVGFERMSPVEVARALKRVPDEKRLAALAQLRQTGPQIAPAMPQLRREELIQMESAGIAIGNHTLTHPCLQHCADAKIEEELRRSHEVLAAALGHAPRSFAYPNGDYDYRAAKTLADLGYEVAFAFDHRVSRINPPDRFRVSRVRVNSDTSPDRFRIIVSGLHPAFHHLRGGQ